MRLASAFLVSVVGLLPSVVFASHMRGPTPAMLACSAKTAPNAPLYTYKLFVGGTSTWKGFVIDPENVKLSLWFGDFSDTTAEQILSQEPLVESLPSDGGDTSDLKVHSFYSPIFGNKLVLAVTPLDKVLVVTHVVLNVGTLRSFGQCRIVPMENN